MLYALLIAVVALLYSGNGAYMLLDPSGWYASTPGVSATGPVNEQFIRDIGFRTRYHRPALRAKVKLRRTCAP